MRSGKKPMLVDADAEVGHLRRMHGTRDSHGILLRPQPSDGVRPFRFHADERDRIEFASILDSGHELILVDLPAASITVLKQVEADYGFFALAHQVGYAVTLVVVVTPDEASMASVRSAAALDPHADLVMIRNLAFGDATDFVVWDGSDREGVAPAAGKAILAERGGFDITMPRLNPGTVALIGAKRISFSAAADTHTSPLVTGRRSQVATWLTRFEGELRRAGSVLGFEFEDDRKTVAYSHDLIDEMPV